MLVDSEPKEECYHSLNWVMAGKANQMKWRGSEMGKQPPCWDGGSKVYHPDAKCSYLLRGTYTDYGGMALYPSKQLSKNDSQVEMSEHEVMLLQRIGVCTYRPLKTLHLTFITDSRYLLQTGNDSCTYKKTLYIIEVKNFYLMFKVLSYPWLLKVKYGVCFVRFLRTTTLVVISSIFVR